MRYSLWQETQQERQAYLHVLIPKQKEQAEQILNELGIPMSNAIGMFLKQVVMHRGIPFEMKLPSSPKSMDTMTKEQFDKELQRGMDDIKAGRVISAQEVEGQSKNLYK